MFELKKVTGDELENNASLSEENQSHLLHVQFGVERNSDATDCRICYEP